MGICSALLYALIKGSAMKLVSINAVLIASSNISLFFNCYRETSQVPTLTLFLLSLIYILLVVLLEYEHRQFKKSQINITESSGLFRKYIFLFTIGIAVTVLYRLQLIENNFYLEKYIFLSPSLHYTMLYYNLNFILGNTYLYLFHKEYAKSNKSRFVSEFATNADQICVICFQDIEPRQKVAKIVCMHKFHTPCLSRWAKQKQECPVCKTRLSLHF